MKFCGIKNAAYDETALNFEMIGLVVSFSLLNTVIDEQGG